MPTKMKPSEIYDLKQQEKASSRVCAILIILCLFAGGISISIPWRTIFLVVIGLPWYVHILLLPIEYILLLGIVTIIGSMYKALFQK